jgi:hypothetical protein
METSRWHWVPHSAKGSIPPTDELKKSFQKPLDNHLPIWYNKNVKRVATYAKPKGKKGNYHD